MVRARRWPRKLSRAGFRRLQPYVSLNATAYGSSPRLRGRHRGQLRFTQGSVRLQSDHSPWRPLVRVKDVSRAFLALLEAPREVIHSEAFNVGRDQDVVQIRTIAERVCDIAGVPVTLPSAVPDTRDYQVDFTKIPYEGASSAAALDSAAGERRSGRRAQSRTDCRIFSRVLGMCGCNG